ncbi:BON domain-containing protein [Granulicella arctica]|uniref:BON domain-containing protein n=1 Tax=Granulicella arctica TaxID=940613 RepID=A0A7Y9PID3_9BACT|nr:BON domain-containing protein [Granulicella arctica]NYF80465.1 hypothetical protein [Granulicella arctica]
MHQHGGYQRVSKTVLALAGVVLLGAQAFAQTNQTATEPDAQIEANVLKALAGSPQLASENIVTNTVYGTVTLSGTVKDEPTRLLAENLASRAEGVKKVVDELTLGTPADAQNTAPSAQPDADQSQGQLQSDGTMAPPPQSQAQHAPDPDVYATQHGLDTPSGQSNPPDDSANNSQPPPQPTYRQPYNGNNQPYPPNQQYAQQPPPYGAQVGGRPVTVPPGSLLRIRINEGLDSKHTQPGTPFDAIVLNDVVADGAVAIPRGASVQGVVVDAKSGGVIKGHGELQLKLTQVTLGGATFPITSNVWTRDSADKSGQTIGSAVGMGAFGALIGAVAGGGPGAAIGAAAGGAAGIGTSAASGSRQVMIPSEAILTFHLTQPAPMTTISQAEMDRLSYGVPAGAPQMRRRYPPPPPGYYGPAYYARPYPY